MPGMTRVCLSAASVIVLMAMPGAISMNSAAWFSSGKKPDATVCKKAASCGCSTSMKVKVRSSMRAANVSQKGRCAASVSTVEVVGVIVGQPDAYVSPDVGSGTLVVAWQLSVVVAPV